MTQTQPMTETETESARAAIASSLPDDVRPEQLFDDQPRIVVGVDGSAASLRAVLFAAREAQLRKGVLHLVSAYDISPLAYGYAGGLDIGFDASSVEEGLRRSAEGLLKEAADTAADLVPGAALHLKTTVAEGRASRVLLDAARGATLLVVGSGGAGALTRLMLGSTSTEVVHHARLPVIVVPGHEDVDQAQHGQHAHEAVVAHTQPTA